MQSRAALKTPAQPQVTADSTPTSGVIHAPSSARLGLAATEVSKVHEQNAAKVASMSAAEIESAQAELFSSFDPSLLQRLRSNLTGEVSRKDNGLADSRRKEEVSLDEKLKSLRSEEELFELSREVLPLSEKDKLRWTGEMGEEEEEQEEGKDVVWRWSWEKARFDFHGKEAGKNSLVQVQFQPALHHHFDEQDKAGYTLKEVLALCRSGVLAQRILGLKVLVRVLHRRQMCLYQDRKEKERHALFTLPQEVYLIARLGMDDSNETVCEAAIYVVRELVVPLRHTQEMSDLEVFCPSSVRASTECWARLSKPQGSAEVFGKEEYDLVPVDTEEEQTDEELCLQSPIQGLLRMNILHRFAFLAPRLQHQTFEACMHICSVIAISGNVVSLVNAGRIFREAFARLSSNEMPQSTVSAVLQMFKRVLQAGGTLPLPPRKSGFDLVEYCVQSRVKEAMGLLVLLPMRGSKRAVKEAVDALKERKESWTVLSRMRVFPDRMLERACDHRSAASIRFIAGYLHEEWVRSMDDETVRVERLHVLTREVASGGTGCAETKREPYTFIQPLLVGAILDGFDEGAQELDVLSAWACCLRNAARLPAGLRVMEKSRPQILQKVSSLLDSFTENKEWKDAAWYSPFQVFSSRETTSVALTLLELALYLGHQEIGKFGRRIRILMSILPKNPRQTAQRAAALEISRVLLTLINSSNPSTWSYGRLVEQFTRALGPPSELTREQRLEAVAMGGGDNEGFGSLLVPVVSTDGKNDRMWEWSNVWGLIPMLKSPREVAIVRDALALSVCPCVQQALSPAHTLVALLQLCANTISDVLFDASVSESTAILLRHAIRNGGTEPIAQVCGGKAALFELYRKVLVNFNESLFGHSLPGSLLLWAMRPESEKQLQRHLWEELVDTNLLRALKPIDGLQSVLFLDPREVDTNIEPVTHCRPALTAMMSALRLQVLTRDNNRPFYDYVVARVGECLFSRSTGKLTWELEDALIDLVVSNSGAYLDVIGGNEERLEAVKDIATRNDQVAKVLANDNISF